MVLEYDMRKYAHLRASGALRPNAPMPQVAETENIGTANRGTANMGTAPIAAAKEEVAVDPRIAKHSAEPIATEDIGKVVEWFRQRSKWRDLMLFVMGVNSGLRVSDLLDLRFCDLIAEDKTWRKSFLVWDRKTRNTKQRKLVREIGINDAMRWCVATYLANTPGVSLSDYMFRSESHNGSNKNKPLSRQNVNVILKEVMRHIDPDIRVASHSMRKTFGNYHRENAENVDEMMYVLQKTFGHSSAKQTLDYIGITDAKIKDVYMDFNIGMPEINESPKESAVSSSVTNIG